MTIIIVSVLVVVVVCVVLEVVVAGVVVCLTSAPEAGIRPSSPAPRRGSPLRLRPWNANGLIRELPGASRLPPRIKVDVAVPVFYHPLLQVAEEVGWVGELGT